MQGGASLSARDGRSCRQPVDRTSQCVGYCEILAPRRVQLRYSSRISRQALGLLGLAAAMCLFAATTAHAQTAGLFGCSTGENHERWTLKNRSKPSSLSSAKSITLSDILGWAIPAGHTVSDENAIPPREPKLY